MKQLSLALAAHLSTGATTLCNCWKLVRRDGEVMGFTDHDRMLSFDGTTYEAASGMTATAIESSLGLAVDNLEALGALASSALNEADLAAGLYDDAVVEIWRVNWQDTSQRVLIRKGNLGEVRRGPAAFSAELRGLAHRLNQATGRVYQYACDVDLGDARCTVDLGDPDLRGTGTATSAANRRVFAASGLDSFADGWFTRGRVSWTGGANDGLAMEVKRHRNDGTTVTIELWQAMPRGIAPGDTFDVTAGCDKQFATCKAKFSNQINFRGFPHMPGNDWVISFPQKGGNNDGGRRTA